MDASHPLEKPPMFRFLLTAVFLTLAAAAPAQEAGHSHARHGAMHGAAAAPAPREPGQAAFAAIAEIVVRLEADPATDWAKVDIDALRRHLVDMDNVTLRAAVAATPVANGVRYVVTGTGAVRESIRRMVPAHAMTMNGVDGIGFAAETHPEGAVLTVTAADAARLPMIRGLGFFGMMTRGMHHQQHHLGIATGNAPHH
jgi:hypothetical protein